MATLVDIQKRLQEQTSQFGAAARVAENGMALRKLTEEINQRHEMMRAALGPIADIQKYTRTAVPPEITNAAAHMREVAARLETRYRLPELQETARIFNEGIGQDIQRLMERYHHQSSEIQRAMEAMRTPWVDIDNRFTSLTGFAKLQGIGHMLTSQPSFGAKVTAALRVDLGDWREKISWPDDIFVDPVVRTSFYEKRGVDPSLTAFPAEAFQQGMEIAGLMDRLPDPVVGEKDPLAFDRTNAAHAHLMRLERDLRWFIDRHMTAAFGESWIKHHVPGELRKAWREKKEKAKASGESDKPLLEYADFMDYEQIIVRQDNWDAVFKEFFGRKTSVQESFQRLCPVRNCTMHARLLVQDDELLLCAEIKRLSWVMKSKK